MWLMDLLVWMVKDDYHVEVLSHPLGVVGAVDEVEDAHTALAEGYRCREDSWRAGRPLRFGLAALLPLWPTICSGHTK